MKRPIVGATLLILLALAGCARKSSATNAKQKTPLRESALTDFRSLIPLIPFDNRSLVKPLAVPPPDIGTAYRAFVNNSLLIREPAIVDHSDFQHTGQPGGATGVWTLPYLIDKTFSALGCNGCAATEMKSLIHWTGSPFEYLWTNYDSTQQIDTIPLRLLAVVNRFDKALSDAPGCPTGRLCGAEFRLVYAAIKCNAMQGSDKPTFATIPCNGQLDLANPTFTLIVEYVLPPMSADELRAADEPWLQLNAPTLDPQAHPDDYRAAVEKTLTGSFQQWSNGAQQARIRVNSRGGSSGVWRFGQFLFTATGFQMSPLDQQFDDKVSISSCIKKSSALGAFLNDSNTQKQVLAATFNFFAPPGKCDTLPALATCSNATVTAPTGGAQMTALTLDSKVVPGAASVDELRYALSINSCNGCHGNETRGTPASIDFYTQFDQLKYRTQGSRAAMSPFLAGAAGDEPVIPPGGGWTVDPAPTLPNCGPTPAKRTFNDLLRRVVFHVLLNVKFPVGETFTYLATDPAAARQVH